MHTTALIFRFGRRSPNSRIAGYLQRAPRSFPWLSRFVCIDAPNFQHSTGTYAWRLIFPLKRRHILSLIQNGLYPLRTLLRPSRPPLRCNLLIQKDPIERKHTMVQRLSTIPQFMRYLLSSEEVSIWVYSKKGVIVLTA